MDPRDWKFRDLHVGDTFDWVNPFSNRNSFFRRCTKMSTRIYKDSTGQIHQVGSINAKVFHVDQKEKI